MSTFIVREATDCDLPALFNLRADAEQRLRAKGLDQWYNTAEGRRVVRKWVDRGEMRLVTDEAGHPVACFALSGADPDFWTEEESAEPALYLYKLIVHGTRRDQGIGDAILNYATQQADKAGAEWLRVDCWQTNSQLHQYFLGRGFRVVDVRSAPGRNSGWLAQRPVSFPGRGVDVHLIETEPDLSPDGDRWDDQESVIWQRAALEVATMRAELHGQEIGAAAALEQAARRLERIGEEQRQRNGMTHRAFTGQNI